MCYVRVETTLDESQSCIIAKIVSLKPNFVYFSYKDVLYPKR
jgi:hypothetical protein